MAVVLLLAACLRADAQLYFGLSLSSTATNIQVSNSVTITINLTNVSQIPMVDVLVTNILPSSVQILSTTTDYSGSSAVVNGGVVVFLIPNFNFPGIAQMTVSAKPTVAGLITNLVTAYSQTFSYTNASTNLVIQVTNPIVPSADLGVAITGPPQTVITNDITTYGIIATNLGPGSAPNIFLTNTLPAGVLFLGVSPANLSYTLAGSNMVFNLGTLANGSSTNLQIAIEPTNPGSMTLSASIFSASVLDTNTANNFASTNIPVIAYLPGTLLAVTNSGQTINLQNGLEEQSILLTNAGTNDVPAARIVVTGLTKQLFNAVGTNNGAPFVYYSTALPAGQSVNMLLQYAPRGAFTFTNGQLNAFAVPTPNWTPPSISAVSTNINITYIARLTNGNVLIEWPSVANRAYTVVYSDNVLFSNAMIAPPSIVAPANEVQWIDYGPPTTVSAPTNSSARFYRVFQNQ